MSESTYYAVDYFKQPELRDAVRNRLKSFGHNRIADENGKIWFDMRSGNAGLNNHISFKIQADATRIGIDEFMRAEWWPQSRLGSALHAGDVIVDEAFSGTVTGIVVGGSDFSLGTRSIYFPQRNVLRQLHEDRQYSMHDEENLELKWVVAELAEASNG